MAGRQQTQTDDATEVENEGGERRAAADRMLSVLEEVATAGRPVAVRDVAEALELPKPTAHRLVNTLLERGLLARSIDRRAVTVGPKLTQLALAILRSSVVQAPVRSVLRGVSSQLGETTNIGVLEGNEVVYLDRVEAEHWPLRLQFGVGSRVPLYCTAMGKLFTANLPEAQRERVISATRFLKLTNNTIMDADRLREELATIRAQGYAVDDEEFIIGVFCIAVPVRDARGRVIAGLAVQGPQARLPRERVGECLPVLREAAEQLTAVLAGGDTAAETEPATVDAAE
ncbi:IclR family transcriptional regulator [Azospirillum sp. RWY-5-1]|uniref:IclR family transcriptional regulator n=1 Tax=Azospirillum oleiclasticum TaxID=2735135 RepID=A0ABX2T2N0_9PROT|nr:IclR family transcriptional regulator [Azospirillum oleiclasticum]NYZ11347.1 IclR family transcriptional regulator [Azospirillum oleiclasticum]NYZ18508.1 IclR family transcriptional regulator [Azospirillum oleiclasticum]